MCLHLHSLPVPCDGMESQTQQAQSHFRACRNYFLCYMCSPDKRGGNTGREAWALGASPSKLQLSANQPPGKLKLDSVEHSTPEGQRSAVTRLGLLQRKPSKKAPAPLPLWLRRAESSQVVWKFRLCGGTSWAGSAGQAGLWPAGSCWPRVPWILAGAHGFSVPPFWHSEGQRAGRGCAGSCRGSPSCPLEKPVRL